MQALSTLPDTPTETENWMAAWWRWKAILMLRLLPNGRNSPASESLLLAAPDDQALELLREVGEIESIWLIVPPIDGGPPRTERIRKIGPLPGGSSADPRRTALHCTSGSIFVLDPAGPIETQSNDLTYWTSGKPYKG